ncbi:Hypothetical protein R9X50_00156700 [Acrodontium crateriforme]|uniref:C2H2-type domain-containing protein n=1 Tax=Acrodontium crateriforme TaxID=150365 RepID=A0AAQ3M5E8_9PEZI|nr:Hypothetical protein R9X50_00156700 [Acrodontium crateriforme]
MSDAETSRPAKRQRASRKNAPKRFQCSQCEKRYSRAEHLSRHQLNHNPQQIFSCEKCDSTFVRPDLYARHTRKHGEMAVDDLSAPPATARDSTLGTESVNGSEEALSNITAITTGLDLPAPGSHTRNNSNATGSFSTGIFSQPLATPNSMIGGNYGQTRSESISQAGGSLGDAFSAAAQTNWSAPYAGLSNNLMASNQQSTDGFAAWLFDSPGSQDPEFDLTNLPFDIGLEYYTPTDFWSFENVPPMVSPQQSYNYNSFERSSSMTEIPTSTFEEEGHLNISQNRRDQIVDKLTAYINKKRAVNLGVYTREDSLFHQSAENWPNVTIIVLQNCISAFWREVSRQMPIIHQGTFNCDESNPLLLLAMIALGSSQLVRINPQGVLQDYRDFADLIATNLRWDIFTDDDAQPPVQLWVAQALLLLELYEKMFSSRRLHERAHIHHASTLTLLRRGSPLVGHSGSDSPTSEFPTRATTPVVDQIGKSPAVMSENMRWWRHWARNESMVRVVFSAFQMDTLHAVLFGHESGLLPYEIRLPLPCDESLWTARSPEDVRRLDQTFSMYNIKPLMFLDGLKKCLHGHDVQSHQNARLILVAGLLSVGYHINRRDKHLQFLENVPSPREQERWRTLLLNAFGHWRQSFEEALGNRSHRSNASLTGPEINNDPTVLYHLAYITMHSDIIDSQILAGSKRLLGRKVSERDYNNVVQRAKVWADTPMARLAVSHAFKLLHETLVRPSVALATSAAPTKTKYACRADPSIYRPWALHLAGLTLWGYQYALNLRSGTTSTIVAPSTANVQSAACQYISKCAVLDDPDRLVPLMNPEGCIAILQMLSDDFCTAESEILLESSGRLQNCIQVLMGITN